MNPRKMIMNGMTALMISALLLGGLSFPTRAAPEYGVPALSVSPSSGAAGSGVTLSGTGFEPGGYAGRILWDGTAQSDFSIPEGGAFSVGFTIPSGASTGDHLISVCAACGDGDVEQKASTNFSVTAPPVIQNPQVTVPQPVPQTNLDVFCSTFDLGSEAQVLNFDSHPSGDRLISETLGSTVVDFTPGSAFVYAPPMGARSGSQALRSAYDDFGSATHPILLSFETDQGAAGLYVGRQTPGVNNRGPVYAILTAYGLDTNGRSNEIASDTVALPASETPIQRCLVVYAPVGQGIHSLSIEYVTEAGTSAYDPRWVDDITITQEMFPPDSAPTVAIISPAAGSTIPSNDVTVLARIHEDRSLSTVTYSLGGGPSEPMTFRQVAGRDPTLYEASATIPAAAVAASTPYELVVTALDNSSQTGEARVSFQRNPGAVGDIWITGIEVTQAIQTLNNDIPLLGGKPTVVRVYVQSIEDVRGPWTGVMASMSAGRQIYLPSLIDPRVGITASPNGSNRRTTTGSFVFLLSPGDTAAGLRHIRVNIFVLGGRAELNTANNTLNQDAVFSSPVSISFYGVTYQNLNPTLGPAPWSDFEAHRSFVNAVFPATNVNINRLPDNPTPRFDSLAGDPPYIQARVWADRMLALMDRGSRIYLLQPEGDRLTGMASDTGWMNGQNTRGTRAGWVMAQEVAHSFGLWWHAPGAEAGLPNYDFPYNFGGVGLQVGFDTRSLQTMPDTSRDFMSYYNPDWVSPYTYCALLAVFPGAPACPPDVNHASTNPQVSMAATGNVIPFAPGDWNEISFTTFSGPRSVENQFLYVAGQLTPDGLVSLLPFEVIQSADDRTAIPAGSEYQLVLKNGSGTELASYDFHPLLTHEDPGETITFSLIVPFDPALQSVSIYRGETLLAERKASPNAPQVSLLSPNAGETWSGMQSISWQAADADDDPLTFTVEYSADNGQTWTPLNTGVTSTSLDVNFDEVPGSTSALVRVAASDGMNTATDTSDGTFRVPDKGPEISISQPVDGANHLESVPFLVSADAFDWEDGPITNPDSFVWSSDRDGDLGIGAWTVLSGLTPGEHTLTVTVSDSTGDQSSGSVQVTIEALDPGSANTATPFSLPVSVWIVIIVLALLLLGGIGFVMVRARK